jgi:hypothetical protein
VLARSPSGDDRDADPLAHGDDGGSGGGSSNRAT